MTSRGRNNGRGRGGWGSFGSPADHEFGPRQTPRQRINVKDDGVQDSNCRVPNNQLDEASIGAGSSDGYNHQRRSQYEQTTPESESNNTSKCTQSANNHHDRRSQQWQPMPEREGNSISKSTQSANNYHDRSSQNWQTMQKREANSNSKSTQSANVVRSSHQQDESADRYYRDRRTQHWQTKPKKEANSSSRSTQSATVVGKDRSPSIERTRQDSTSPNRSEDSNLRQSSNSSSAHSVNDNELDVHSSSRLGKDRSPNIEKTLQQCTSPNRAEVSSLRQPKNSSLEQSVNENELDVQSSSRLRSSQKAELSQLRSNSPNFTSANLRDTNCISKDIPSAVGKTHHVMISSEKAEDHLRTEHLEQLHIVPFDICRNRTRLPLSLKPSILEQKREKKKELECSKRSEKVLRQGMVLLKKYISHDTQVKIIEKCRELGLGPGGFYQPGYRDGAKLHLQMMCLGKNWDPDSRVYGDRRSIDDACPPSLPVEFRQLVEEAIQYSYGLLKQELKDCNVEEVLPRMSPDLCIVNFYSESGKLGLHQDRDETQESIKSGLPVVSFSIGDSAEFLYGDDRDIEKTRKVILESGDVLIFGGKSRLVYHGVTCIMPKSAPSSLVEKTSLRPGRINLTFRKL